MEMQELQKVVGRAKEYVAKGRAILEAIQYCRDKEDSVEYALCVLYNVAPRLEGDVKVNVSYEGGYVISLLVRGIKVLKIRKDRIEAPDREILKHDLLMIAEYYLNEAYNTIVGESETEEKDNEHDP